MPLLKPCLSCGALSDRARCPKHRPKDTKASPRKRGYTTQWDRLSKRARTKQPFCNSCGSAEDLTADHSPEAWAAQAKGLPITEDLITVLCRSCNARKGAAR